MTFSHPMALATVGVKTKSSASTLDLYPTLCELAGLPIPEQPIDKNSTQGRPLGGVSLVPILKDPDASVREGAITLFKSKGAYGYAYLTKQFRYIEWISQTNKVVYTDLYDYKKDPLETKNVAKNPEYAEVMKELSQKLHADPSAKGTGRLRASGK